jgi:hypothetical protein
MLSQEQQDVLGRDDTEKSQVYACPTNFSSFYTICEIYVRTIPPLKPPAPVQFNPHSHNVTKCQ